MPSRLWGWDRTSTTDSGAGGGKDVLIIFSDLPLPDTEAVARRSGQLTKVDKQRLQNQDVPPDCKDELAIAMERYNLDKECRIVGVRSGKSLSRVEVMNTIAHLLTTRQNDGGKMYLANCHV